MPQYLFKSIGILLFCLGLFYYTYQSLQMGIWMSSRNDFAHLYLAGYLAQKGGNFFDLGLMLQAHRFLEIPTGLNPFVYPPFFAIILIPLSWIPYDSAWLFFFVLSQTAFFLSLLLMVNIFSSSSYPSVFLWGSLFAFSAAFFPLFLNYSAGQVNTFMLLVLVLSRIFFLQNGKISCGVILGLGAAIKISPGFLLLYYAWKKQWTVFWSGIITIIITFVITLIFFGVSINLAFFEQASQMAYGQSTAAEYGQHYHVEPHNQAPSALWYRLLTHNPSTTGLINSPLLAKILSYITALTIVFILLKRTPRSRYSNELEYSLWIIGGLMIPSLMWDHYLVQMLYAVMVAYTLILLVEPRYVVLLGLGLALMCIPFHYDFAMFKSGLLTLLMPIRLYGALLLACFLILNQKVGLNEQAHEKNEI